jgi:hypothetical protein
MVTSGFICPYCKAALGKKPRGKPEEAAPGYFCLCYYCGEVSKFDNELVLVRITAEELITVLRENPTWNIEQKKIIAMAMIK